MKCNFIKTKIKDKNKNLLELYKLSLGNNVNSLYYNKNKIENSKQSLEIIYYKRYIKKNIGKMKYKANENDKQIKIFNESFVLNNIKRAKIIINNKQYKLKKIIGNKIKTNFKIKIKFLDNIIKINSMFKNCKLLSYVNNFQNFNTKYLKTVYDLFMNVVHYYI